MKKEPKKAEFVLAPKGPVRTEAELRQYDWKYSVLPKVEASGLDQRFRRQIHSWHCPPQEKVYRRCRKMLSGVGAIIALVGLRGAGKTTIAGQIIIERAWLGKVCSYRKLVGIISDFKAIYGDMGTIDEESITQQRDNLCRRGLVVIDELHEAIQDSRHGLKVLTDIIDRRYAAEVDTLLISNQTAQEFRSSVGDSILSRIIEHGEIIPCEWESWRERIAEGKR